MKIVLFFILISLVSNISICFAFENYNQNWHGYNSSHNASNNDILNYLENSIYGKNYPYNSTQSRIKKLEKTILGQTNIGTNTDRITRLHNHYTRLKRSNIQQNRYLNTRRKIKRLSRVLFGGVPTGYTPSITQGYQFNPKINNLSTNPSDYGYEQEFCDIYGNCRSFQHNMDTQMGVKIIRD